MKKLSHRQKFWLGVIAGFIFRIAIKLVVTYGYTRMFNLLGLDMSVATTILSWVTSWWIASMLFNATELGIKGFFEKILECIEYAEKKYDT